MNAALQRKPAHLKWAAGFEWYGAKKLWGITRLAATAELHRQRRHADAVITPMNSSHNTKAEILKNDTLLR
jgi:hypothetical protein